MNKHLKSMLDELCIPAVEQQKLGSAHGIVSYDTLKAKQYQLDRRDLVDVDPAVQRIVATALRFLKSLDDINQEDPLPKFTKKAWSEFATTPSSLTAGSSNNGHGVDASGSDGQSGRIFFDSDLIEENSENDMKSTVDAMMMDFDENESIGSGVDDDQIMPDGMRKGKDNMMVDDDVSGDDDKENGGEDLVKKELGKFEMMEQGFQPSVVSLFAVTLDKESNIEDDLEFNEVLFEGRILRKGRCYYYKSDMNDEVLIVGIKTFKIGDTAGCVRVEHISKSFLGSINDDDGEFENAVKKNHPNLFAQFDGNRPRTIALTELGEECMEPSRVPQLIYEPRTPGDMMSLAYIRDNSERTKVHRRQTTTRVLEGFAGCGGMHIGFSEEGYVTVCAIEWSAIAMETFIHNNPGVPTYIGDIRDFLERYESNQDGYRDAVGRVDVIHLSPPCQGFSKANRFGGANDDENNSLSLLFPRFLLATGARVGTFENVQGMWSQKGIQYLCKVLIDCMALGYQVRVKVLHACDYGDPQRRPRLIIFAAKWDAPMPDHPLPTHGNKPGLKPYVLPMDVLEYYCNTDAGMASLNMDMVRKATIEPGSDFLPLSARKFAPAIKATGAPVVHYKVNRCITVREAASLQSFPADYEILGTLTEQYRQVGNAVPVGLARAIARSVRDSFRSDYVDDDEE